MSTDGAGPYFLVLDLGTGGIHASLITQTLDILESGYEAVAYTRPSRGPGWEFNAEALFRSAMALAGRVLAGSEWGSSACRGLVVTSQRHGMVLSDRSGRELLACPNVDNRASPQAARIAERYGPTIYDRTGRWPDSFFPALRLVWLREEEPGLFAEVDRILMINEWFVWRLTGIARSEPTNAAETLLLDLPSLEWSDDLRRLFGLEGIRPVERIESGATVGGLSREAASLIGLAEGLPVHMAHSDTQAAVLGTGAVEGEAVVVNGSTTPVVRILAGYPWDRERRVWASPFSGDVWLVEANANVSGLAYRRLVSDFAGFLASSLRDLGLPADEARITRMAEERAAREGGGTGFWGPRISDVKTGKRLESILVTEGTVNPFEAILPSFLENLAFAVHQNILLTDAVAGSTADRVYLTGGGSRNEYFVSLLKALLPERTLLRTRSLETTSLGAVLSAMRASDGAEAANEAGNLLRTGVVSVSTGLPEPGVRRKLDEWLRFYSELAYPYSGRNR